MSRSSLVHIQDDGGTYLRRSVGPDHASASRAECRAVEYRSEWPMRTVGSDPSGGALRDRAVGSRVKLHIIAVHNRT